MYNVTTPAQWVEMQKGQFETINAVGAAVFAAAEKLLELNLATARAALQESAESTQTLLGAKDVQEFVTITSGLTQPTLEKVVGYSRNAYGIASGTGAELTKIAEAQFAESNRKVGELIDLTAKNVPGTEPVLALVKSAVAAANNAFDTVSKATRQATDWAESNFAAAASATINAASAANDAVKGKSRKAA